MSCIYGLNCHSQNNNSNLGKKRINFSRLDCEITNFRTHTPWLRNCDIKSFAWNAVFAVFSFFYKCWASLRIHLFFLPNNCGAAVCNIFSHHTLSYAALQRSNRCIKRCWAQKTHADTPVHRANAETNKASVDLFCFFSQGACSSESWPGLTQVSIIIWSPVNHLPRSDTFLSCVCVRACVSLCAPVRVSVCRGVGRGGGWVPLPYSDDNLSS